MADAAKDARARVVDALGELVGVRHAVFVQNGTAAVELALRVLTRPRASVLVPALGCWTVAHAARGLGRRVRFGDVDRDWSLRIGADEAVDAAVLIDPWGAPANWALSRRRRGVARFIVDATQSPGARVGGERAGAFADAVVVSLGAGKPLDVGAGGVALFADAEAAKEAQRHLRFGFVDGAWQRATARYTFSRHLFAPLAERLAATSTARVADDADRARERVRAAGFTTNGLARDGAASWGLATALPIVLGRGYPLSPRDVESVALTAGIPLTRHPVAPAYAQPAWSRRGNVHCARAEAVAERLLFLARAPGDDRVLSAALALLARLADAPRAFRSPYAIAAGKTPLASELVPWAHHRLVRDLEGRFGLFDEELSLMMPVSDGEAATVQARVGSRRRT